MPRSPISGRFGDRAMADRQQQLHQLCLEFLDAFNRNDLDAVMAFFSADAIYEELHGKVSRGVEAIRATFAPQFSGKFGTMTFVEDDTFIDAGAGKVMSSWDLHLTMDNGPMVLRGLDLLQFEGDKIVRKQTFCKAKTPLYQAG
jgi:ketosteroid isomerase-like protein